MAGSDLDFSPLPIAQAASHHICTPSIYSQPLQLD